MEYKRYHLGHHTCVCLAVITLLSAFIITGCSNIQIFESPIPVVAKEHPTHPADDTTSQ